MADSRRTVIPLMLLGDGQVGKTSLTKRLTGNVFEDSQLTTIGKESYVYQTQLHGYDLKMKIWDTAGQERFKSMSVNVIKNVEGLILTYSIIIFMKLLQKLQNMLRKHLMIFLSNYINYLKTKSQEKKNIK